MRPELAALVVHDLKNALGALEAELGLLAGNDARQDASPAAPAGATADRDRARRSHAQCTALRERFVQFLAVYGAGDQMQAHCQDESPHSLLTQLADASREQAAGPALRVVGEDQMPPFWYFDRRLVRMALDAALHNARRFAREQVLLSARSEDGYLVFTVDDDGPGLGAVDPDAEHSTGLGTALCESVARAHSTAARAGRVTLADRAGGGARFELWLG